MTKITQFDRATLKMLVPQMEEYLKTFAKELGLDMRVGNVSFDGTKFKASVEMSIPGAVDPSFARLMGSYGLVAGVKMNGRTLVDYKGRSSKPFVFTVEGKEGRMVCDLAVATRYFGDADVGPKPSTADLIRKAIS